MVEGGCGGRDDTAKRGDETPDDVRLPPPAETGDVGIPTEGLNKAEDEGGVNPGAGPARIGAACIFTNPS